MKIAEVRFLEKEEQLALPRWTKCMTEKMQKKYVLKKKPFIIEAVGEDRLVGTLCHGDGQGLCAVWREKAELLLEALAQAGAGIVIAPYAGEFPRKGLPFAEGAKLTPLFAFSAGAEALQRQGKNPAQAQYIIAGNDKNIISMVLAGMGEAVNHLAFFTEDPDSLGEICDMLYEERGLLPEVFSSPKNALFSQGDVVIVCGMEQTGYEHILKRNAILIEAAGNRPVLRRLTQRRWDVAAIDGFFFLLDGAQIEGRTAEARMYQTKEYFRVFWDEADAADAMAVFLALQEDGIVVCGFSLLGNRVKIVKS